MSIYSGFALRKQESRYNNLLINLVGLISDKLCSYISKSENDSSFKNKFAKIIYYMKLMEDQKYLPPKFTIATNKLYDLLDIQSISVNESICISQLGNYEENDQGSIQLKNDNKKSKTPSPITNKSKSPYQMSLVKGLGGKEKQAQKNNKKVSQIQQNTSIEASSPQIRKNSSLCAENYPQVSQFQYNDLPFPNQQFDPQRQQQQYLNTNNQYQHQYLPHQQNQQQIQASNTNLQQAILQNNQNYQQIVQPHQQIIYPHQKGQQIIQTQPVVYLQPQINNSNSQQAFQQKQLYLQNQNPLQVIQQPYSHQQSIQNIYFPQQSDNFNQSQAQYNNQSNQQLHNHQVQQIVQPLEQIKQIDLQQEQIQPKKKIKKINKQQINSQINIENQNMQKENDPQINRQQQSFNIQYITNSNVKIVDHSKIQLVIENDSTSCVQVQDFLQNTPIDSQVQKQTISVNDPQYIQKTSPNKAIISQQNSPQYINQVDNNKEQLQDIDFENNDALLNGKFTNQDKIIPLKEKSQLINQSETIQNQSKRYLPSVPKLQNQQIVYLLQTNKKPENQIPSTIVGPKIQNQQQNMHHTKRNSQNDSFVLDKQKKLQKTITEKMINMTSIFENVQNQNSNQNTMKANHSQINFPVQNDDFSLPSIQPLSTTSKKTTILTKDIKRVNQLKSDFLILNKTKDVNEYEEEEETNLIPKNTLNHNKRSLSTNTQYIDVKNSVYIQEKGHLTQFQKRQQLRNNSKNRNNSNNLVRHRKSEINSDSVDQRVSQNNIKAQTELTNFDSSKDQLRFSFSNNPQPTKIPKKSTNSQQKTRNRTNRDKSASSQSENNQLVDNSFVSSAPYFGEPQKSKTFLIEKTQNNNQNF
ncbi:hypothetical protein TTHERM_00285450 (macronuclear) [Tetrahymena thermophila SB210]|uniref:Uncharacterized protein n=1 Tax=Tetrahymena thermophila (strain SB210) TaxID=312017 RepID=I7MF17_TETTS|nr:hypothetical protein TTHERM_00285450 [Tetrahymena thermophila SB210]EAR98314.2 hypothetical protein TTHERM_00285450 [Tetrahymena thermophila SB210]|eukprot:XP_001018559.2 hypothetical protein TTHERM_00285450 [Tetrahymena thermophila SB210]